MKKEIYYPVKITAEAYMHLLEIADILECEYNVDASDLDKVLSTLVVQVVLYEKIT